MNKAISAHLLVFIIQLNNVRKVKEIERILDHKNFASICLQLRYRTHIVLQLHLVAYCGMVTKHLMGEDCFPFTSGNRIVPIQTQSFARLLFLISGSLWLHQRDVGDFCSSKKLENQTHFSSFRQLEMVFSENPSMGLIPSYASIVEASQTGVISGTD